MAQRMDPRPLPVGWDTHWDPKSKYWYYRHNGVSTWYHPADVAEEAVPPQDFRPIGNRRSASMPSPQPHRWSEPQNTAYASSTYTNFDGYTHSYFAYSGSVPLSPADSGYYDYSSSPEKHHSVPVLVPDSPGSNKGRKKYPPKLGSVGRSAPAVGTGVVLGAVVEDIFGNSDDDSDASDCASPDADFPESPTDIGASPLNDNSELVADPDGAAETQTYSETDVSGAIFISGVGGNNSNAQARSLNGTQTTVPMVQQDAPRNNRKGSGAKTVGKLALKIATKVAVGAVIGALS
ncbi:hypothetical protein SISNIDRAFT_486334 [Sistotremastrum niveocremeum HHB9708]|uniref:WW domain-containing protein n=1 Tax=Sistotremastrum niveocremeum HHB9708 TaxID=1314777 RepID=A0A164U1I6_9AGAM|nr:hypothetical protein SISNIDRAFT_486334 [Sistotremastrum niveocremeum HHB9708]